MTRPDDERVPGRPTRQVNLKLAHEHEELARLFVRRLREGGPEHERRVRVFLSEALAPRYMHVDELDRRFGAIERRLYALEASAESQRREA